MEQTSNQLQISSTESISNNFSPSDLPVKSLHSPTSKTPACAKNQASYFDDTAYFSNPVTFGEQDYFAYSQSCADGDLTEPSY